MNCFCLRKNRSISKDFLLPLFHLLLVHLQFFLSCFLTNLFDHFAKSLSVQFYNKFGSFFIHLFYLYKADAGMVHLTTISFLKIQLIYNNEQCIGALTNIHFSPENFFLLAITKMKFTIYKKLSQSLHEKTLYLIDLVNPC